MEYRKLGNIHVYHHRSASGIVGIFRFDSGYGSNRDCYCHVSGLERARDYFYMEIPERKREDISGELRK